VSAGACRWFHYHPQTLNDVVPSQGASLRTNGISRNFFYKAANQAPECGSFSQ
jgi:hypothetical protein